MFFVLWHFVICHFLTHPSSFILMKIVHLVAGAGGMYCGSCLYGNTLAAAIQKLGEEAILAPMYTPIRTDEENVSIAHVAFGGINVYLQEHFALFRHTPWFFDRLFDSPGTFALGYTAQFQRAAGTSWGNDGFHAPGRRRPATQGSAKTGALARA